MARKIGILDDSATMRAAFQFTFAGEDLGVEPCLYSSADEVLRSGDKLELLYIDSKLGPQDGYHACSQLHATPAFSSTPLVILYGPLETLDAGRASAAGAAGGVQKPWESDDMIAKMQAFLSGSTPPVRPGAPVAAPAPAPAPPPAPVAVPRYTPATAVPAVSARPLPPGAPVPPPQPGTPRIQTQIAIPGRPGLGGVPFPPIQATKPLQPLAPPMRQAAAIPPPMAAPAPMRPAPAPLRPAPAPLRPAPAPLPLRPAPAPLRPAPAPAPTGLPGAAAVVPVDLERKLAAEVPGLSPEQLQAVLRVVSREIIEQVAWEVVPDLAETIIREQLQALLKE